MTVESIKEDIMKTLPPKEEPKQFNWNSIIGNAEFMGLFESLFGPVHFSIDEVFKNYESTLEDYEEATNIDK